MPVIRRLRRFSQTFICVNLRKSPLAARERLQSLRARSQAGRMCAFLRRYVPVAAVQVDMARIRNLTKADIQPAVELLIAETTLSPPYATESWHEFVELYLGRDVLFLAEEDSLLSGLVCFFPAPILAYGGYVQFLVVRPEMRGRGIGRQLLGFVERMVFKRTADMYF